MHARVDISSQAGYTIPAIIEEPDQQDIRVTVVMSHGIFSSKDENGRYPRQAQLHHAAGRRTIRFDWQGHGNHPLDFSQSSIAGDVDDLETVFRFAQAEWGGKLYMVASSFGASIFLLQQRLPIFTDVTKAVLLNPVTDYRSTFFSSVSGELTDEFSQEKWRKALESGRAELSPGKVMTRRLAIEFLTQEPYLGFQHLQAPTIVIHGTADASVSFSLTKTHATRGPSVTFEAVEGADHAFAQPWEEKVTFDLIRDWFNTSN